MTNPFWGRTAGENKRAAFTLVELLVVVGIIAVLISILLPALNKARQQANTIKCMANLHQIGHLIELYANNNKNSLPIGYWNGDPRDAAYNAYQACDWTTLLANTMDPRIATDYYHSIPYSAANPGVHGVFICPSAEAGWTPGLITHYSAHPRLMPALGTADPYPVKMLGAAASTWYLKPYKVTMIKRASEILLMVDGSTKSDSGGGTGGNGGYFGANVTCNQLDGNRLTSSSSNCLIDDPKADTAAYMVPGNSIDTTCYTNNPADFNVDNINNWSNVRFRHGANNQTNVLYCDGHCETAMLKDHYNCTIKRGAVDVNWVWCDTRLPN